MPHTLTFAERTQENMGWTSFWSYYPEQILGLGNRFYTIKNGQLWEHNDNNNSKRNHIYGVHLTSNIVTILNQENAEDKIFKNVILEGNQYWSVNIKTNYTQSNIKAQEFIEKESKWMAYTRKNERTSDYTDRMQGIGDLISVSGSNLNFFSQMPMLVSVGEQLYQTNGSTRRFVGVINNIVGNTIVVTSFINTPQVGWFFYCVKNARVQGSEIRGYYAELSLSNRSINKTELFAVSSNVVKSYVGTKF